MLILDFSGIQPLPTPASTDASSSNNDNASHSFTITPGSSVPQLIATPCHDAQAINNSTVGNDKSPAGDQSNETLHLRLLSAIVVLLIVVGAVLIAFVCVRSFIQKKTRKRGFDKRDGSDMTSNPMYNAHTSISTTPFILSPFLGGSTAIGRFSNNTSYENPDRVYENPDRYGEISCGMANTSGMPTLLNSIYTSRENGDCGEEKYNDYTIATPLNPAYSSLQRQQSLDHPLTQQQEESKANDSDESLLDTSDTTFQRPRSAIIVPMNGEIMKTPSQLFEIIREESEVSDTSTAIVKQENDGGKMVEEEREDAQQKEPNERYCIFIPQKDL